MCARTCAALTRASTGVKAVPKMENAIWGERARVCAHALQTSVNESETDSVYVAPHGDISAPTAYICRCSQTFLGT